MTALELLTTLHALDVVLSPTCDYADVVPGNPPSTDRPLVFGVHVKAPIGVLTPMLRDAIRQHKPALIDLLEAFEERAAIAQHGAGLSQADAEALAWQWLEDTHTLEVSCGR